MASIELNPEQKPAYTKVVTFVSAIEKEMLTEIEHANGEVLANTLARRIALLASCAEMMSLATAIYDWAKGVAANEALAHENVLNAKQDIQRKWFDGRLSKWNSLYVRAERSYKDLAISIEGLRSLLSYEKSLAIQTR